MGDPTKAAPRPRSGQERRRRATTGDHAAVAAILLCLALPAACAPGVGGDRPVEGHSLPDALAALPADAWVRSCPSFRGPWEQGEVDAKKAKELSGLMASRRQPGVLWAENDGENGRFLVAFTRRGEHLGDFKLEGTENRDWEDLGIGPGPDPDLDYIYVADIGDNAHERKEVRIYRLPEPEVDPNDPTHHDYEIDHHEIERIDLEYEDGEAYNAEAFFVDPVRGDLYVITKALEDDEVTSVFVAPAPLSTEHDNDLWLLVTAEDTPAIEGPVLAADIAVETGRIIIKLPDEVRIFTPFAGLPLYYAFFREPCVGPVPDGHFESVAYAPEGNGYYLVPEGEDPEINYVQVLEGGE